MIDTKALRKALAAATPGPWESCGQYVRGRDGGGFVVAEIPPNTGHCHEDSKLIAAAVNALPELLDELERLQKACRLAVLALAHATQEHGEVYRSAYESVSTALQERTS